MRLAALLKEAGLPDGVLNVVHGARAAVEALADHPRVQALGFVGSTRVGRLLYGRAAATGKRVLCLGSAKNNLIVFPDAEVQMTAQNVVASSFGCAGQRCMASSLVLAVGAVDHIVDAIVLEARKLRLGQDMGAIVNRSSIDRIHGYIDGAEKMGAKVLVDGRGASVPARRAGGSDRP